MAGETIAFSQADLAATAAAFNPAVGKAPIVVGHPATDDPAMGWVERLEANERGLFAYPKQVDPAFAESARAGRFGTLSAMFYRPTDAANPKPGVWYLKHVGALGAQQPAVKGLDDPAFAASAAGGGVCFAEGVAFGAWEDRTHARLWRGLRDFLISKFGQEQADTVVPSYQVESLEQAAYEEMAQPATAEATPNPAFSESHPTLLEQTPMTPTPEQLAKWATLEAEHQRLKDQLAQAEAAKRHAANVAFCESIAPNKLLPAWRGVAVATLDAFDAAPAPVQFGEGEAQAPLADKFKAFLQALPEAVAFGESATTAAAAPHTEINPLLADAQARATPAPR